MKAKPKLASCSPNDVIKALHKLGDFSTSEGGRHTIIVHNPTGKKSTIPRHPKVNRYLLKDFVEDYLIKELRYSEEEVYQYLRC